MITVPTPEDEAPIVEQAPARPDFVSDIRASLAKEHARLPDHEAQRQLMERLRAKHVGTLHSTLHDIGTGVREHRGVWYALFIGLMVLSYFTRFGLRSW